MESVFENITFRHVSTSEQAAERMKVTVGYIARLCREGRLDALQVGGTWFISNDSIEEWLMTKRSPGRPRKPSQ